MLELRAYGATYDAIARSLEERGFARRGGGTNWNKGYVSTILKRHEVHAEPEMDPVSLNLGDVIECHV